MSQQRGRSEVVEWKGKRREIKETTNGERI